MGRKRKRSRGHHISDLLSVSLALLLIFLTWNNAFLFYFNEIVCGGFSHLQARVFPGKGVSGKGNLQFLWRALEHFLSRAMPKSLTWLWWCKSQEASMMLPLQLWALLLAVLKMASRWQRSLPPLSYFWCLSVSSEDAMAPHSGTFAWKILWTEEPGRLHSMGSLGVGHDWATSLSLFTFRHWRRKWQPTPVFLPGESQGQGSLVGCRPWGSTESDTTEAT